MTQNQIAYWNMQEQKRANLAKESETERSNKAKERETFRSNVAQEGLTHDKNVETERHNRYGEKVDTAKAITGGIKDVSSAWHSLRQAGSEDSKRFANITSGLGSLARGTGSLITSVVGKDGHGLDDAIGNVWDAISLVGHLIPG